MGIEEKIVDKDSVPSVDGKVVLTNGGFSVIHYGHLAYLNEARQMGDALVVAVNTNDSIERVKGYSPPSSDEERFYHLASLGCVDFIVPFDGDDVRPIITSVKPDLYVKGGDYSIDTINPEERELLEKLGVPVAFTSYKDGYSASEFVKKIRSIIFREER